MENIINNLGGRKFIISIIITIGVFLLNFFGKIKFEELSETLKWILGLYIAGNVAEKLSTKKQND